jgi:hypothetical protein
MRAGTASNPKHWDTLDLRDLAWQKESGQDEEWGRYENMSRKKALNIVRGK